MQRLELYKYNPSRADLTELEQTFVGRENLVQQILAELRKQIPAKANQNFLIKGHRGIGKTNMLRILLNRISNEVGLSRAFLPLTFAEEEYSIITLRDFFIKILELLQNAKIDDAEVNEAFSRYTEEPNDETAVEASIGFLKHYAQKQHKKILLFIDNFDMIFGDQIREKTSAHRLREVLMNHNFLLIIATTPTYFKEVMDYHAPLYQFFKQYELEEFDVTTMEAQLIKRAQFDGNIELAERIPKLRNKLRALGHLTGGNPRLVLMLYQLLALQELPEVKAMLKSLLDDMTYYYKLKLERLTPQPRKVVDTLARMGKAASPTEIARQSRIPVNQVSTLLNRLRDEGYIALAKQARRKATYYILSERLFRIWHQMRFDPNSQLRLAFLVEFIAIWYSLKEAKGELKRLEQQYQTSVEAGELHEALQASTDSIIQEVNNQNLGQIKNLFTKFLSYNSAINKEDWHNYLLKLFGSFLSKSNVNVYVELEKILREHAAEDELKLLFPISKVYEYWQRDEDPEVLDRLNPEVREVVEDILVQVESWSKDKV